MARRKSPRQPPSRVTPRAAAIPSRLDRWTPWLVQLAVPWLLFCALELLLHAAIGNTALGDTELSIVARASLVASSLTVLGIVVALVGAPLLLAARRRETPRPPLVRWSVAGARVLFVWAAVLLYIASWTTFWQVGVFLDRAAFLFWLPNPVQVFHWVYPPLAVGILVGTLTTAIALGAWVPRLLAAIAPGTQRRLVVASAWSLGTCAIIALLGAVTHRDPGPGLSRAPYEVTRDERTGPLLHALSDLRDYVSPPKESLPATTATSTASPDIVRRPIVSMERYLSGIDSRRRRPLNVLMIQVESLRSDQLRAYGGTRAVMPTVDALADDSLVFGNAYVQASHSNYADLVSLSSQYPLRSVEQHVYPKNPPYPRVLIYDVLKAIGYKTAIFSSQNENWGGMINYHRPEHLDQFFHAATFSGPTYAPWEDVGFAEWVKTTKGAGSVDDRYTVDAAVSWLETLAGSPFFLHMNLQSSHLPYVVPADFARPFGPKQLDFTILWGLFPRDKINVVKDRYADSLFYEDMQIARLFECLRRQGLWENTIVVIGGDNGEAFYEHGFAAHASGLFNEVMKVPMIIRAPGVTARRDERPAMFLDVPPTILDILGLPPHPGFQGVSLVDPRPNPMRSIYMIAQTPVVRQAAIVRERFKLIFAEPLNQYVLFDLTRDPGEQFNIAEIQPQVFEDMFRRLHRWRAEQLSYYMDPERQAREYPPVLND